MCSQQLVISLSTLRMKELDLVLLELNDIAWSAAWSDNILCDRATALYFILTFYQLLRSYTTVTSYSSWSRKPS